MAKLKSRSGGRGAKTYIKAEAAYNDGRFQDAYDILLTIPKGNSKYSLAQKMLGQLEMARGNASLAVDYFAQSARKLKTDRQLYASMTEAALASGRRQKACDALKKLYRFDDGNFATVVNYGNILSELGQPEQALRVYEKALVLQPESALVLGNMANLYAQLGKRDNALELFRKALLLEPENGELYHDLSRIKKFKNPDDDDVKRMESLMQNPSLTSGDCMYLGFALGKAYDDMGDADRAIKNFLQANGLKKQSLNRTAGLEDKLVNQLIEIFNTDFCDSRHVMGTSAATPLFVLGMPRSGTTLIEQIIGSHSLVYAAGERDELRDAVIGMDDVGPGVGGLNADGHGFPLGVADLSVDQIKQIGEDYLHAVMKKIPETAFFTDKMPRNVFFLGIAALAVPNAKFIYCTRSPLDTCLSCFFLHFPEDQDFSYDLEDLGRYYRACTRIMAHWQDLFPDRIKTVRYEDVVENPEREAREILDFCGLEWQPQCLDFHKSERRVTTASASQVRQPIYTSSMKRWWKYREHLGPLIKALGPLADVDK